MSNSSDTENNKSNIPIIPSENSERKKIWFEGIHEEKSPSDKDFYKNLKGENPTLLPNQTQSHSL